MIDLTKFQLADVDPSISPRTVEKYAPTFMVLGPQRTGTTWLAENLRRHPQIKFSKPKEPHYFNTLGKPHHPMHQTDDLGWYLSFFRDTLRQRLARNRYCLRQYGEFYQPIARGEGTASYASLDSELLHELITVVPDVRGIMIIRDPVQRAWSHAKKVLLRDCGRRMEDVRWQEFQEHYQQYYHIKCPMYERHFQRWSSVLKPNHMFVARFEEIVQDPRKLLLDIMSFVGVRSHEKYLSTDVGKAVNPTDSARIPEQHQRFLQNLFADQIKRYVVFSRKLRAARERNELLGVTHVGTLDQHCCSTSLGEMSI